MEKELKIDRDTATRIISDEMKLLIEEIKFEYLQKSGIEVARYSTEYRLKNDVNTHLPIFRRKVDKIVNRLFPSEFEQKQNGD